MAYARKSNKEVKQEWTPVKDMMGFTVIGNTDRFSINFEVCEGLRVGINGCRIIDGEKGPFISYPAWKDNSGKYHRYAYITLTDEEIKNVIDALK